MNALRLADQIFLIGHDEYSGKTAVNGEILDTGLAGAVLGELLLTRRISCSDGKVVLIDPRRWGETVTDAVATELHQRSGRYVVRAWVEHLRPTVRESVAHRLITLGLVRPVAPRGVLARRGHPRYPGVDPTACAQPQVKLAYVLGRTDEVDLPTALLGALVLATGLERVLTAGMSRSAVRDGLARISASLPSELAALAAGVQEAVAAIALTVHR